MACVLVIDDCAEFRTMACEMLATLGYTVKEAEDGKQGLKSYRSEPADVVLLDMFMPVMDGLETLGKLLLHDPDAQVIAITGGGKYGNVGILQPAMLLGARTIMYKPITAQELQFAIEKTLAKPT